MNINLRYYQNDLISGVKQAFTKHRKVLLVAPCGSGKTVIATELVKQAHSESKHVWFIVHRKELVDQAVDTFKSFGVSMKDVDVYMIQSLKNKIKDIKKQPDLIIIDEAHHATSSTYMSVINTMGNSNILGLTATPVRLSGKPLGDLFESMVQEVHPTTLIKEGYLADYEYYAPKVDLDFTEAKIVAGDYKSADIDFLMDKPKIYGDILNNFKKLIGAKQTIIYCASIDYSLKVMNMFKDNGYTTNHIDGSTPKQERDSIVKDFKDGKLQILCNVDLIGEGFDVPGCEAVVLLRPTQSLSLYIQQSTRCLRPSPNKKATIIDFVGNAYRHGMPTEDREWDLEKSFKCDNKNAEPEVKIRQCGHCFRCYKGTGSLCPYCWNENGKTRAEIKHEEALELELLESVAKKEKKKEQGMAKDYDSLVALAKARGYKNPQWWAKLIMKNRRY